MNPHQSNQAFWDASANWWKEKEDHRGLWRKAHENPSLVLGPLEMSFVNNIGGKEVCVLGSGDNEVAFALVGLGGRVTSVDFSQRRLDIAANRASQLGLQLSFLQADVTDLSALASSSFNLVYTGGHVSVWVADIEKYYSEAVRILKSRGIFLVSEYHPIRRMWTGTNGKENSCYNYLNRGPYEYRSDEGLPTFEYHWTVSDHVQSVVNAGCELVKVEEHDLQVEDEHWLEVNLNNFPSTLIVVGRKKSVNSDI